MKSIDKNDVDVGKLFNWGSKFEILDSKENILLEVYIRIVGDAELNRARVYALRRSAELRNKLKDSDSDERIAFIPNIETLDKENIVETTLLYLVRDITMDTIKEIRPPLPVEPSSDSSLEKQENYQKEIDEYPKKKDSLVRERVEQILELKRQELLGRDMEVLYKEFERSIINQLCEDEMITKFREMCAYLGIYKDINFKELLFSDFKEFENLPKEIKDQFLDHYNTLEISGEDLKKLLEATQ